MKELNIGMIGFGTIAPFYVEAIHNVPGLRLLSVCVPEEAKRVELASSGYRVANDAHSVFDMPDIDAVIIATPNVLHAPLSISALASGKHVLCEKPMATRATDAMRMIDAAARAQKHLAVAFHNRHSPLVLDFVQNMRGKKFIAFKAVFRENILNHCDPSNAWYLQKASSGGGCVIDNGTNFIDVLYTILGPLKVTSAHLGSMRDGVEMDADITFSFGGGAGRLILDWQAEQEEKHITFSCDSGENSTIDLLSLEALGAPGSHMREEYINLLKEFERAIHTNVPVSMQGVEIQKIVDVIYDVA